MGDARDSIQVSRFLPTIPGILLNISKILPIYVACTLDSRDSMKLSLYIMLIPNGMLKILLVERQVSNILTIPSLDG